MDIALERSYPTPLSSSPLLPLLLLSLAQQRHTPRGTNQIYTEYDYVIVGAGSAGSVVASRLSEVPCISVLLLEAGPPPPLLTEVPAIGKSFFFTNIDWKFKTTPQKHTGRGLSKGQVVWPSGKALGGSSILNGMIYMRGNRRDYDHWAANGAKGWSYRDVLPYFKKAEDNRDPEYVANGFHGTGGPLTVQMPRYRPEFQSALFRIARRMGYPIVDPNARTQTGFYDIQSTIRNGQRCSTAKAYLVPAENRTNLDILPNAMVKKVLIRNRRAVGVQFDHGGRAYEIKARKEVILSAGTTNTAQLLLLSGIGPRRELQKFGIPVIADLPVGLNFHDHAGPFLSYVIDGIPNINEKIADPKNIRRYIYNRTGVLGSTEGLLSLAYFNNRRPSIDLPNYETYFVEGFMNEAANRGIGLSQEVYKQVFQPYENKSMIFCFTSMVQAKSRGKVSLQSTDFYDPPLIDPNYFADSRDLDDIVDAMKMCKRISTSREMQKLGIYPIETLYPGCEQYDGNDDEYFRCVARSAVMTYSHQVGTAKMGNPKDPSTVVDTYLRVKGIAGLRVIDASIMPFIPSGNTNVPTIMIAEKASDFIKDSINCQEYRSQNTSGEYGGINVYDEYQ